MMKEVRDGVNGSVAMIGEDRLSSLRLLGGETLRRTSKGGGRERKVASKRKKKTASNSLD